MSSFLVEKRTIDIIVSFIIDNTKSFKELAITKFESPTKLGQELLNMNIEALKQRYGENVKTDKYIFSYMPANHFAVAKRIDCLLYQCLEGNVPETKLYRNLEEFRKEMADWIVRNSKEYNEAYWG